MSDLGFLEKLLNGASVEWKTVADIFNVKNGYTPSKSNKLFWENGTVPWFRMDDIRENGRVLGQSLQNITEDAVKGGKLFPANSMIFATSATIGEHALITVPYLANQRFTNLALKDEYTERFDKKFLFYYGFLLADWCNNNTTKSSFASVDMNGFRKFLIPIPCPDDPEKSLAIQAEIVRILDSFTELTDELTVELEARTQQYNHYRDQLLSFEGGDVEWKPLGELCTSILAGGDVPEKCVKGQTEPSEELPYPVFANAVGEKGLYGFSDSYRVESDAVTISARGAKIGYHTIRDGKFTPIIRLIVLVSDKSLISTDFLNYVLEMTPISGTKGGIPQLTVPTVKKITVPVPFPNDPRKSLAEQARIVGILDKFNTLTTSLSEGLPREIKLRQQQYEYYRDLLLSFPKPPTDAGEAA